MTLFYCLTFVVVVIYAVIIGYHIGIAKERKSRNNYSKSVFGKIAKWELDRRNEYRGFDAIGTYKENSKEIGYLIFIPDKLIDELKKIIK